MQESEKYLRAPGDFLLQKKLKMPRNMAAQGTGLYSWKNGTEKISTGPLGRLSIRGYGYFTML